MDTYVCIYAQKSLHPMVGRGPNGSAQRTFKPSWLIKVFNLDIWSKARIALPQIKPTCLFLQDKMNYEKIPPRDFS